MDEKELFKDFCFLPSWTEKTEEVEGTQISATSLVSTNVSQNSYQRKDLTTLLAELEAIKNTIEDIKAKKWHLAKLMEFHKAGFAAE